MRHEWLQLDKEMNVGIVVDSTCDLPNSIVDRYQVHILPLSVKTKSAHFIDGRHPEESNQFYKSTPVSALSRAEVVDLSKSDIVEQLKNDLIYQYDHLLILAPHIKLSSTLTSLRAAVQELQTDLERLRKQASIRNAFKVRIIETQTSYAGYGLVLYEALRLISEKARSVDQLKQPLDHFKGNVETYVLPGHENFNPNYLGQPPFNISWFSQQKLRFTGTIPVLKVSDIGVQQHRLLKASHAESDFFEMLYDKITRTTFKNHMVNLSYAGNLSQLRVLPTYNALQEHIKSKGGKLVLSVMSPTAGVQLGAKTISVAFAG